MPSKHLKTFFSFIFAVILTLGLSISFQSLLAAYTAPLVNPSGCTFGNPGCDAPINVGPANQSKAGGLGVVGAFIVSDNSYFNGKVGVKVAVPDANVQMQITAPESTEGLRIVSASNYSPLNIQNSSAVDIFRVDQTGTLAVGTIPWARLSSFPAACTAGKYVSEVGTSLTCTSLPVDNNTTYSAGAGLSLTDTTFSINTATTQRRVTGNCAAGSSIRVIDADGTVTCEADDDNNTTYTAGTGISIVGTTINNSAPDQTVALTGAGATSISGTYPNFTISSTDTDTNTTYTAGTGISISGTTITNIGDTNAADDITSLTAGTGISITGSGNSRTISSAAGSGTVTSITAGTGLAGGTITTSGTISLNTANANTWTGTQTFSGQINATGNLCINGDCKSSWAQANTTSERIVQKVTRNGTWPGYNCATASGDTADGNPCDNDFYKCTRADALANRTVTDIFGYNGWDASATIQCSMEYTSDSSNSIQIELNDPTNTNWECGDLDLHDYCGDEDGCTILYYGQHKTAGDDQVRNIDSFMYMEQPGWSSNKDSGQYGYVRQDGGESAFITGKSGTNYNILGPWEWYYMMNYRVANCGGDNTTITDPYVFRFMSNPAIHSKIIIYDKP